MSKPWMKFYPADWRADPALRSCTMAARGLWMEMLCIMHEAEPYGHLVIKGRPVTDAALASLAGIGLKECRSLLSSLREVGVFSASPEGVIYSRRMVKDHAKALRDKENGSIGGNPALKGGVNPQVKAQKPEARDQRPDSSGRTVQTPPEKPKPDIAVCGRAAGAAEVAGKYEFEAGIIRLTPKHFNEWQAAFPNLSLRSELMGLVEIAQQIQGEGGNWFMALPRILAKRNREAALAVERIKADAIAKAAQPKPVARGYVC